MADQLRRLWRTLKRRKVFSSIEIDSGNLKRCLTRWDLTALGVGSTLGVGVYVIVGNVARNIAGPSLVISFLLAALVSFFAGLCYAEFGARVPKAGSAYIYSYVCVGEFVAFIIGWNLILEYMIGTASVARGLSLYVDSILSGAMLRAFQAAAPLGVSWMSPYFDFFAFFIVIVLGLCLSFGMRESSSVNNALSVVNIAVVLFVIVAGAIAGKVANWNVPAAEAAAEDAGAGGFFPYGAAGTLQGAAVCFYGFVGFDCIATTGEEVRDPRRAIPFAIMLSLLVIFLGYFGVSTVVTMMVPYYAQNIEAPLPYAFSYVGWEWARWLVAVGATFGLCASLFGAMFPLPRIIYSMASDGLLFRFLGHVTAGRRSPVVATLIPAFLISIMGAIFKLKDLVSMMAIGTLLAYTIVATCVLILRYGREIDLVAHEQSALQNAEYIVAPAEPAGARAVCLQLLGVGHREPSPLTRRIVLACMALFVCTSVALGVVRLYAEQLLVPMCSLGAVAALLVLIMSRQPRNKELLSFQVPLVPLVPCLSIISNIYLMMMLEADAWNKFLIWIAIGLPVYFTCLCMYDRKPKNLCNRHLQGNLNQAFDYGTGKSGKSEVTVIMQSSTPATLRRSESNTKNQDGQVLQNNLNIETRIVATETINTQNHVTQRNRDYDTIITTLKNGDVDEKRLQAERETQIIELLDQVLKAEEESYAENESESNISEWAETRSTPEPDVESVASAGGGYSLSYAVVALVHREDASRRSMLAADQDLEETVDDNDTNETFIEEFIYDDRVDDHDIDEKVIKATVENEATLDAAKATYNESKGRDYSGSTLVKESNTAEEILLDKDKNDPKELGKPFIPVPPPMDEHLLSSSNFKRAHTILVIPRKNNKDDNEEPKSRERTFSGGSYDDTVMVFGSDKRVNFMNRLNDIFLNKPVQPTQSKTKRSQSSSHLSDMELDRDRDISSDVQRPILMFDLKNELLARTNKASLDIQPKDPEPHNTSSTTNSSEDRVKDSSEDDEDAPDLSMNRKDLKIKLENIFASGGPKMLRPRLIASNPPTPEPSREDSAASAEGMFNSDNLSTLKDKTEKSDTLKLQKAKFGEVLNSFKVTMAKDGKDLEDSV